MTVPVFKYSEMITIMRVMFVNGDVNFSLFVIQRKQITQRKVVNYDRNDNEVGIVVLCLASGSLVLKGYHTTGTSFRNFADWPKLHCERAADRLAGTR